MSGYVFCLWQTQSEREVSLSLYLVSDQSVVIKQKIKFPLQKLVIFCNVKEIKELRGGVQVVRRTSDFAD